MSKVYPLKIDAYTHIAPLKYKEALERAAPEAAGAKLAGTPPLYDLDRRFRIMDKYDVVHVLAPAWPAVEEVADSKTALELSRILNDEMAALVHKYPERFVAAVACLPMNDVDAALAETERAIEELRFRGVLIYTPINDKPLDSPEFLPLYEKMAKYDLPILIHPMRPITHADYKTEQASAYKIFNTFGWLYETTTAMTRIVFSGILEKFPNLKFVTHHCGGMVPYFAERVKQFHDLGEMRIHEKHKQALTKSPIDYYKMFYNDTALYGNPSALMCARAFCGAEHLLFGVDFPLGDLTSGDMNYRKTINAIEEMDITEAEKKLIYEENARRIYRLPI